MVRGCTPGLRPSDASFPTGDPRVDGGGDLGGIWGRTTGSILRLEGGALPESLVLDPRGAGRLLFRQDESGVLTCDEILHARSGDVVMLESGRSTFWPPTRLLLASRSDANTLLLREAGGATATFSRIAAVAEDCLRLTVERRFDGLPVVPHHFSGLAYDGTSLWYEADEGSGSGRAYPVNPATGVLGTPVDLARFTQFSHVHAMQSGDFWTHCGCGVGQEAQRQTAAGTTVDTIDTRDLGDEIGIYAIAYDPVARVLYLHGSSYSRGKGRLLRVDSDAEPDVLLGAADLPVSLAGMTWDGTQLWGLIGGSLGVVRIDPATNRAVATYEVPDASVEWQGIAAVGSRLYLIGRKDGAGVLVAATP